MYPQVGRLRRASTPLHVSMVPSTRSSCDATNSRRWGSAKAAHTTTLTIPYSSSSVTKVTPLAIPGRCRSTTKPAIRVGAPARPAISSAAALKAPVAATYGLPPRFEYSQQLKRPFNVVLLFIPRDLAWKRISIGKCDRLQMASQVLVLLRKR